MNKSKLSLYKNIIKGGAILLCVMFFTLPLVQCSQDNSKTASGLEIATGTGSLFSENDSGYPAAFLLLIIPAILLISAFRNKSFKILRNISIAGLGAKIIFLIIANSMIKSGGYYELTGYNWFVLIIYIGLSALTFYCAKSYAINNYNTLKICPFCSNEIKMEAIICQFCNKDITKLDEYNFCVYTFYSSLRIKPERNANVICKLKMNEFLKVIKNENEFSYVVTTDSKEGWSLTENLKQL
ncbi:MAG: hypothetical protein FWC21_07090 [Treponema sp.]|nr:hypothetical protein [Treponema sp.]